MKNFFARFHLDNVHVGVFNSDYQTLKEGMLYLDDDYNLVFSMKNGVDFYIDSNVMAYYSDTDDRVWYIKNKIQDRIYRKSLIYIDDVVNGIFLDDGGFLFTEDGMACFETDCGSVYKLIPSKYIPILNG